MSDLFGLDDENNNILANLDNDALHIKSNWPGDLVELSDVIRQQLKREGVEDEQIYRQMDRVLLAMSFLGGGRGYYLPKGDRIKNAVRDKRIYDSFNGSNIHELVRKFALSEQKIYNVIREQRALHLRRVQHNLFSDQ